MLLKDILSIVRNPFSIQKLEKEKLNEILEELVKYQEQYCSDEHNEYPSKYCKVVYDILHYKSGNRIELVKYIDKSLLTEDLCFKLFKINPKNFKHIPETILKYNLCKRICIENTYFLKDIPLTHKTNEFYEDLFGDIMSLSEVVENFIFDQKISGFFQGILKENITTKIVTSFLTKMKKGHYSLCQYLCFIPKVLLDKDEINDFINKVISKGKIKVLIEKLPKSFVTQELAEIYADKDIVEYFNKIPDKFVSQKMVDKLLQSDLYAKRYKLEYIPERFFTQKIANDLFSYCPDRIHKIPRQFITYKICKFSTSVSNKRFFEEFEGFGSEWNDLDDWFELNEETRNILSRVPDDSRDLQNNDYLEFDDEDSIKGEELYENIAFIKDCNIYDMNIGVNHAPPSIILLMIRKGMLDKGKWYEEHIKCHNEFLRELSIWAGRPDRYFSYLSGTYTSDMLKGLTNSY